MHRWLPATDWAHAGDCPALAETAALDCRPLLARGRLRRSARDPEPVAQAAAAQGHGTAGAQARDASAPPAQPRRASSATAQTCTAAPVASGGEARAGCRATNAEPPRPAQPLPPARWWVGGGAGGLLTASGDRAGAVSVAIALERPVFGRRLGLRLSAGAETPVSIRVMTGACVSLGSCSADVLRLPVRMGAYLPIALGVGQLEPGIGIDLDVIAVPFTRGTSTKTQLGATPGIDAALGWAVQLPHNIFIRALAEAMTEIPYDVVTRSNERTILTTPSFRLGLGIELGLWFP